MTFDFDGTLAPMKWSLDAEAAVRLRDLLEVVDLAIISGAAVDPLVQNQRVGNPFTLS
jgi:hypothetical protein